MAHQDLVVVKPEISLHPDAAGVQGEMDWIRDGIGGGGDAMRRVSKAGGARGQ